MKKVGLIILNYNDSSRTMELLESVIDYNVWYKIVIVDNKSTDNSMDIFKNADIIRDSCNKVYVIESKKNGGYSYGNNVGMKFLIDHYNVDICVIANPDVQVEERVIKKMVDAIVNADYSAVAPLMLDKSKNYNMKSYKAPSLLGDVCGYLFPVHAKMSYKPKLKGEGIVPVYMLPGSLFAISARALEQVNYLDESTFLYCEERILAERLHRHNLQLGLLLDEFFVHLHEKKRAIESIDKVNRARIYYYQNYKRAGHIKIWVLKRAQAWYMFWYKKYIRSDKR